MLRPRIIPCLLVRDKGLVKTVQFKDGKYVGDPINAVRIFNEKQTDELTVLDIDATSQNREPDFQMIEYLASECRMPLCYGGGVKTVDHAVRLLSLGVEKVALSSAAIDNPALVTEIAEAIGTQSVVVILDVKKKWLGGYEVYTHNAQKARGKDPAQLAAQMELAGAGEIVINAIDQDGMMKGYDLGLMEKVRKVTTVPLTALGGAGSLDDLGTLIRQFQVIGAAVGSLFVFKGVYKAVLINYPTPEEKQALIKRFS